jgi:hypothetical protein
VERVQNAPVGIPREAGGYCPRVRGPSTARQLRIREAATPLWMTGRIWDQLPSLLARFQLINSPIVELVLETGCL